MRDEVVEEIRERRKKMLREDFADSIKRFGEEARRWQQQHPERVVNLRARRAYRKAENGCKLLVSVDATRFLSLIPTELWDRCAECDCPIGTLRLPLRLPTLRELSDSVNKATDTYVSKPSISRCGEMCRFYRYTE